MGNYIKLTISIILLLILNNRVYSQDNKIMEAKVRSELQKRGLEENEVRDALIKNNINPDNLDKATPDQIVQIQKIIEDLEAQKKAETKKEIKPEVVEEVRPEKKEEVKNKIEEVKIEAEEIKSLSKVYGHELFNLAPKEKTDLLKVNENYILGPGDKISISVWSNYSQLDNSYVIEKDGYIKFDKSDLKKRVFLNGLTFSTARTKIEQVLSRYLIFNNISSFMHNYNSIYLLFSYLFYTTCCFLPYFFIVLW